MKNIMVVTLMMIAALVTIRFAQSVIASATAINTPVVENTHYERDLAAFRASHQQ